MKYVLQSLTIASDAHFTSVLLVDKMIIYLRFQLFTILLQYNGEINSKSCTVVNIVEVFDGQLSKFYISQKFTDDCSKDEWTL